MERRKFTATAIAALFGVGNTVEKLAHIDRTGFTPQVKRVALALERVALQRRLGEAERRAGAHVPLPQVHVAGQRRAVEQAFAQRHVLVRADRLETEEFAARVRDHEPESALGFALLEPVFRHVRCTAHQALGYGHQLNLS